MMNYYKSIQNAIVFIEKHLQEELRITEIAAAACFSAFHFQRLFQAISGFTVQEYIRKRRLSESVRLLDTTDMNVLEIAIASRYSSQEAFTRAFESYFGVTPGKYRKRGQGDAGLRLQTPINFIDYETAAKGEIDMKKPAIIQLNALKIIGYEYKTSLTNKRHYNEIPGFHQDFGQHERFMRIPDKLAPGISYGISCNFHDNGDFSFVIGEEVRQFAQQLESGFVNIELPAGQYAEFEANGPVGLVQEVRDFIYGTWLPNSNYERKEGPDFEVTDVLNSTFPNDLRIKIYIPLK